MRRSKTSSGWFTSTRRHSVLTFRVAAVTAFFAG
jgi:hypothetical protein